MSDKLTFQPRGSFEIKVGWPLLFPENEDTPFVFHMRMQMVGEAERIQEAFMALEEKEQTWERTLQYDAAMIAQLSTQCPTGFPDLVIADKATMADTINKYLYQESDSDDRKAAMSVITRGVMAKYWRALTPKDYL